MTFRLGVEYREAVPHPKISIFSRGVTRMGGVLLFLGDDPIG
jgi:hypothetical protein